MINKNNLNYSRATEFGCALQKPLFYAVSKVAIAVSGKPHETQAQRISKIAMRVFIAVILIIPVGLSYLVGKAVAHSSPTQIHLKNLPKVPNEIHIPENLDPEGKIVLSTLSDRYKQLEDLPAHRAGVLNKKDCFDRLCLWVSEECGSIYPENAQKRKLFCAELSQYLKSIIIKLQDGSVSKDKEREILMELAEASTRCYPTWLAVSAKIYGELYGNNQSAEDKVLGMVQQFKENVILAFSQNDADGQWHALSFVRNVVGKELGLNTHLNQFDPYGGNQDRGFGASLIKWLFMVRYQNVNRLVSTIQDGINQQPYDLSIYQLLLDAAKLQQGDSAVDFVADHFYDEEYKMTFEGANFLLRSIGVLK